MSGGSYDYAYIKLQELGADIRSRHRESPLHVAFGEHLHKCADVAHDIEWADSCDWSQVQALETLAKFFQGTPLPVLTEASKLLQQQMAEAARALEIMNDAIKRYPTDK